jgi:mRNA interferase MazF
MEKDYQNWHGFKSELDKDIKRPIFKEREIWWCSIGLNVGDEQNGKSETFSRPILIIRKFNRNVFLAVPLSTQIKDKPYYHQFILKGKEQSLIMSQIRLLDAKRLDRRIIRSPEKEFTAIKEKIKNYLFG